MPHRLETLLFILNSYILRKSYRSETVVCDTEELLEIIWITFDGKSKMAKL